MLDFIRPLNLSLIIALTFVPKLSFAGGSAGGGGQVLICPGKKPVILDYAEAEMPTIGGRTNVINPDNEPLHSLMVSRYIQVVESASLCFLHCPVLGEIDFYVPNYWSENTTAGFEDDLKKRPATLKAQFDIKNWLATKLNPTSDAQLPFPICPGGKILQAARNVDGMIYADPDVISLLSKGQIDVLEEHEAWYSLLLAKGCVGARPVRDLFRVMFDLNASVDDLTAALDKFFSTLNSCNSKN